MGQTPGPTFQHMCIIEMIRISNGKNVRIPNSYLDHKKSFTGEYRVNKCVLSTCYMQNSIPVMSLPSTGSES